MSDRHDPHWREYYGCLTDLIAIFLSTAEIQLDRKDMPLAATNTAHRYTEFRPDQLVERVRTSSFFADPGPVRKGAPAPNPLANGAQILDAYEHAIQISLQDMWLQYARRGGFGWKQAPRVPREFPEDIAHLTQGYPQQLAERAEKIGRQISQVQRQGTFSVGEVIYRGIKSQISTSVQMSVRARKYGLDTPARELLLLSTGSQTGFGNMAESIGLTDPRTCPYSSSTLDPDSKTGIDMEELRRIGGSRSAIGCPAGKGTSHRTRDYLESRGIEPRTEASIMIVGKRIYDDFTHRIGHWYDRLSTLERGCINPQDVSLLTRVKDNIF